MCGWVGGGGVFGAHLYAFELVFGCEMFGVVGWGWGGLRGPPTFVLVNPLFQAGAASTNVHCENHDDNLKQLTRKMPIPFLRFNVNNSLQFPPSDDDDDFQPAKKKPKRKKKKMKKKKSVKKKRKNTNDTGPADAVIPTTPFDPPSLADAFLVVLDGGDNVARGAGGTTKRGAGGTTNAARENFLTQQFATYDDLNSARELLGLNISQSSKDRSRIRYRDKSAPKKGHLVCVSGVGWVVGCVCISGPILIPPDLPWVGDIPLQRQVWTLPTRSS